MQDTTYSRRTVLKTAAGATAAATVGGGAILATTGTAAAQSYSIDNTSVTLDDGQVSYVDVQADSTVSWDGYDVPVKYLEFVAEVRVPHAETGWHELHNGVSGELPDGWSGDGDSEGYGGPGEYVVSYGGTHGEVHTNVDWRVIGTEGKSVETPLDAADTLAVPGDGDTTTFTVQKRSTVRFLDASQSVIPDSEGVSESVETATFDVTVTNQPSQTGGQSAGSSQVG